MENFIFCVVNYHKIYDVKFYYGCTEAHSGPCQINKMKYFVLLAVNCFRKTLHLRCSSEYSSIFFQHCSSEYVFAVHKIETEYGEGECEATLPTPFHLIYWCENFVEPGDSPEALRKLCLFTKFPHQKIR